MQRKIVQDIVQSKRSIRDIPLVRNEDEVIVHRTSKRMVKEESTVNIEPKTEYSLPPKEKPRKRKLSGAFITFIIIFIGIALIAFALSLLYSKAVVKITPKIETVSVAATYTAKKSIPNMQGTDLPYEVISIHETAKETVPAADGALTETKARGEAILYNAQSFPQMIIAGTRLSDKEGLIYRTTSTVTIPQQKTTPGTIIVEIVADEPGTKYNTSAGESGVDLKVVAYKGTDRYNLVYGKVKGDIKGGFSGNKKIVAADLKKTTQEKLQENLKTRLMVLVKEAIPEDYVFYNNAYIVDYNIPEPISKDSATADISVTGTISAIIFKKDNLTQFIAGKDIQKFPSPTYIVKGLSDLDFSITNSKDFDPKKGTPLIFNLKGDINIVGTFPENTLKNELQGVNLAQSNEIFTRYPAISNAHVLITPFWMRSFPNSAEKIIFEVRNE